MSYELPQRIEVVAALGTVNLDLTLPNTIYEVWSSGTAILSGNASIQVTAPTVDTSLRFVVTANVTLNGNTFSILGQTFTQAQLRKTSTVFAFYSLADAAWKVFIDIDDSDQTQVNIGTDTLTIPNTGTTTLVVGTSKNYQRASNTVTLLGNTTIAASTVGATTNDWFWVKLSGGVTLSTFSLTIIGQTINANDALNGGVSVFAWYDGSAWQSQKIGGTLTGILISSLEQLLPKALIGNPTNTTTGAIQFSGSTEGGILMVVPGTDALGFSTLVPENFTSTLTISRQLRVPVSNAAILAGFATPIELIPAPAVGFYNVIEKITVYGVFGSAAFATNLNLYFKFTGATADVARLTGYLGFTSSQPLPSPTFFTPTAPDTQNVANASFVMYVPSAPPTVGTGSSLVVEVSYQTYAI